MAHIEDYALVGDLHTGALIGRDGAVDWLCLPRAPGAVDWLCLPRFDAPACFAAMLGDENTGQWRIAPDGAGHATRRRYAGDTLILETEWDTTEGTVRLTDFMPPRGEAADLVRIVEGVSGTVRMRTELTLRFDYGQIVPWVRHHDHGITAIAGPDAVWLHTGVPLHSHDRVTTAE